MKAILFCILVVICCFATETAGRTHRLVNQLQTETKVKKELDYNNFEDWQKYSTLDEWYTAFDTGVSATKSKRTVDSVEVEVTKYKFTFDVKNVPDKAAGNMATLNFDVELERIGTAPIVSGSFSSKVEAVEDGASKANVISVSLSLDEDGPDCYIGAVGKLGETNKATKVNIAGRDALQLGVSICEMLNFPRQHLADGSEFPVTGCGDVIDSVDGRATNSFTKGYTYYMAMGFVPVFFYSNEDKKKEFCTALRLIRSAGKSTFDTCKKQGNKEGAFYLDSAWPDADCSGKRVGECYAALVDKRKTDNCAKLQKFYHSFMNAVPAEGYAKYPGDCPLSDAFVLLYSNVHWERRKGSEYIDGTSVCAPKANGKPCAINPDCVSNECDTSARKCSPHLDLGATCTDAKQCITKNCERLVGTQKSCCAAAGTLVGSKSKCCSQKGTSEQSKYKCT